MAYINLLKTIFVIICPENNTFKEVSQWRVFEVQFNVVYSLKDNYNLSNLRKVCECVGGMV